MANERFSEFTEETPKTFVQGLFEQSATQKQKLGTERKLSDGREFVYCKLGAANSVAGHVYQGVVPVIANQANMAIPANANVGERAITITFGATSIANAINALAEGYVWINSGVANGHCYKIKSHAAIAANANGTLYLYDKIRANITTGSLASVVLNPCYGVIQAIANLTAVPVGVATYVGTANYYVWLQKKGPHPVETDGTVVAGDTVICSNAAAGTIMPSANGLEMYHQIGKCIANNANDHWSLIDLDI